jgi:hypothetical protein
VELSLGMVHLLSRLLVTIHSIFSKLSYALAGIGIYAGSAKQGQSAWVSMCGHSPSHLSSLRATSPLTCNQIMAFRRNEIIRLVLGSLTRPVPRTVRGPRAYRRLSTQSSQFTVGHSTEEPSELFEYTSGRWMFVHPLLIELSKC